MRVPYRYSLRGLMRRKVSTIMTALGIALVVAVFIITQGLATGIRTSLSASGHPLNYVVLRQGSTAETTSFVARESYHRLKQLDGIQRMDRSVAARLTGLPESSFTEQLVPLAAPELLTLVSIPRPGSSTANNVLIRGVTAVSFLVHPEVKVIDGRMFRPGMRELTVSRSLVARFQNLEIGRTVKLGRGYWTIVGHHEAGDSAFGSEIWTDAYELGADLDRPQFSSVTFRANDSQAGDLIASRISSDPTLSFKVLGEIAYYKEQMVSALPLTFLGGFLATLMSLGAVFAAMNTMYANIASRTREIGTLKVLGFMPGPIQRAFVRESVMLSLLGGLIGCAVAFPMNGLATGTANFVTFSELTFKFRLTPDLIITGLTFAVVIGALGGWLPARAAARRNILEALKDTT